MGYQMYKIVFGVFLVFEISYFVFGTFRQCLTPLGDVGSCVSLKNCPEVLVLYQKLPIDQATKYSKVLKNLCGNQVTFDDYPVVCCAKPNFQPKKGTVYELIPVWIDSTGSTLTTSTTTETPDPNGSPKIITDTEAERSCQGRNIETGYCRPLDKCTELFQAIIADSSNETVKEHLRYSHSICGSIATDVCCPVARVETPGTGGGVVQSMPFRPPTEDEGCGRDRHVYLRKVIGGEESEIGSWPWMALLGYDPYSMNPFRCGGTLITARHVLTAAHCILIDLSFVRLGEHDLSIEDETDYIDVNVAKAIKHDRYSKTQMLYDIALVFLEKIVDFTTFIQPICLPMSDVLRSKNYVSYSPYAAGWGRVSSENSTTSSVLREVQLLVHDNAVCRDAFRLTLRSQGRRFIENNFDSSVLCAGDLSGKRDTCRGDSGGPLMVDESYKGTKRYYHIGVTSFGIGCGRPGVPAIYTSTQYFIDWILQQMKET